MFYDLKEIGLTASTPILRQGTSELLGVAAIDYRLEALSQILNDSIGDDHQDENWFSWIFEAKEDDPRIMASSDFNVLTSTESILGCLQLEEDEESVPYTVLNHPEPYIRIMSTEAIEYPSYGVGNESTVFPVNDSTPFEMEAPMDYPITVLKNYRIGFVSHRRNVSKCLNNQIMMTFRYL